MQTIRLFELKSQQRPVPTDTTSEKMDTLREKNKEICYGDAIEATADIDLKDDYEPDIEVHSCYKVTKYIVADNKSYNLALKHQASLKIGKKTYFEPFSNKDIPYHFFQFASYDDLDERMKPPKQLTGVVEKNFETTTTTGKALTKLDLRDEKLKDINIDILESITQDNVTIQDIVNLPFTQEKEIQDTRRQVLNLNAGIPLPHMHLQQILTKTGNPQVYYVCAHHENIQPKFMYCVNATIVDESAMTDVVFFNEVMADMLATSCQDMVTLQGYDDTKNHCHKCYQK
ncbi:hypothetical protein E3N88_42389 [Mikania micrantha]|uniref:Replication factor A C-terminal domain-containing protein n=1 Tax=Mikania micrantha TaxID=192012 RepID=A0A5N6LHW5_9ASTR|nr:hypothetical protein E3N88_42389 [Mikania micrantha]